MNTLTIDRNLLAQVFLELVALRDARIHKPSQELIKRFAAALIEADKPAEHPGSPYDKGD